jgi:SAM-dependent methyltransferase
VTASSIARALALPALLAQVACDPSPSARATPSSEEEVAAARASYDRYRRPELLIAALGLQPGDAVADVGAGNGYLEPYLAAATGANGRVVATDIDADALAELRRRRAATPPLATDAPVETRLVRADDPELEAGAYDLILLAQVDHLLADREAYLRRLLPALAPGGRIALSNRLTYRDKAVAAAERAGLAPISETHELPGQFLILFTAAHTRGVP